MQHDHDQLTADDMWGVCVHVRDASRYHVLPDFHLVLCDACVQRGPDAMPMDELRTTCPECVRADVAPVDWSRPEGYQVDRA